MKIKYTDARDGKVVIGLEEDANGSEIILNSIELASLSGMLQISLEEAISQPAAKGVGMPGIQRVQYVETPETLLFRIYLNDRIFHEYPVPHDTNLGIELKKFADQLELRNLAKANLSQPGDPTRKN